MFACFGRAVLFGGVYVAGKFRKKHVNVKHRVETVMILIQEILPFILASCCPGWKSVI